MRCDNVFPSRKVVLHVYISSNTHHDDARPHSYQYNKLQAYISNIYNSPILEQFVLKVSKASLWLRVAPHPLAMHTHIAQTPTYEHSQIHTLTYTTYTQTHKQTFRKALVPGDAEQAAGEILGWEDLGA
jgi:hypothetical protein